ncbi:carbohydrate-binding module family 1 protein [Dothidotthia symphoricarpi CBS 119687]|uniref:AA9 family lytic polysaccharide monooxygenase n=1 Tax=Dothidotthia symphoricarpi CBS 119687 TaxID=1392245 RepID=A0A6A6A3F9_9PLEO|nr:carbohydrate-binding module family 1 protein [Dothidotthia symphoricarpi CBS 119687]KAF2125715.1 carbohydrate-binding module family 1 protein [Dothidotthia symphoricarpi CBS 119687]
MKTVAILAGITAIANAHATFQQLWKNGEDLESTCARLPSSNSPIEDYTSTALQCNVNPAAASGKCAFEAGDTVTVEMHQHDTRSCTEEGLGGAHWGPVLAYMSKVEDAAAADGSSEFFKVYQNGWKKNAAASQGDNDYWGTKDLNYNCGKLDFVIPSDLAPGDYLLRAEAIALHAASTSGGAQHYVTCYQLTVTGSGSATPAGVTFPEAYTKTGPGLGFSIHADLSSYPMPGPDLISSGTEAVPQLLTFGEITGVPAATGGASKSAASTSATKAAVSTAAPVSFSATPIVSSTASAASSAAPISSVAPAQISSTTAEAETTPAPATSETPSATSAVESEVLTSSYAAEVSSVVFSSVVKPSAIYTFANSSLPASTPASALVTAPSTLVTSAKPVQTSVAATGPIKIYYQCGGLDFKGANTCEEGLECKEWNPYYSQCVKPEATQAGPSKGPMPSSATLSATATATAAVTPIVSAEPTVVAPVDVKSSATAQASATATATTPSTPESSQAPAEDEEYSLESFIAWLEEQDQPTSASSTKARRHARAFRV